MGRNKDELIKLAEKITGQECKDVLTKKDALKKIACHYLGEEKEFASIADCLECIVEYGASGGGSGSGDKDKLLCFYLYTGRSNTCVVYTDKQASKIKYGDWSGNIGEMTPIADGHLFFTNTDLTLYLTDDQMACCQLVYADDTTEDLRGKFIQVTE